MPSDTGREATFVTALRDVFNDLSDLFRKELRLAKAEVKDSISHSLQAGIWMGVAGILGFVAALVLIQAVIFGIASLGLGVHWAALIVAVALGAAAAGAFFYGKSRLPASLTPSRTLNQVNQDITAVREQLT